MQIGQVAARLVGDADRLRLHRSLRVWVEKTDAGLATEASIAQVIGRLRSGSGVRTSWGSWVELVATWEMQRAQIEIVICRLSHLRILGCHRHAEF